MVLPVSCRGVDVFSLRSHSLTASLKILSRTADIGSRRCLRKYL